ARGSQAPRSAARSCSVTSGRRPAGTAGRCATRRCAARRVVGDERRRVDALVLATRGLEVPLRDDEAEEEVVDDREHEADGDDADGVLGNVPVEQEVDRAGGEAEA